MMNLPCVCGHLESAHDTAPYEILGYRYSGWAYCHQCYRKPNHAEVHPFKLDNLRYIEQLATERGLA